MRHGNRQHAGGVASAMANLDKLRAQMAAEGQGSAQPSTRDHAYTPLYGYKAFPHERCIICNTDCSEAQFVPAMIP